MKKEIQAKKLLLRLGIKHCTTRHLKMIEDFIESGDSDLPALLSALGDWDQNDLTVAEVWFKELEL